ncbi:hypothetical protein [Spirosoma sp. KUDC1026]|uniref:hypothetical protein n=1 Tax=Spirosoma sp. KUDC1026 TaxID=2745947 RepID=UPI00159BD35B|nr:hypothetical protein [Spirosoma sp. KUDC1026]QKZ11266.1 hypothetical protein HU175_00885 [Spirosoma sp. KUDC1026]
MKQKNDELPDEWVRQTLSRLPDAPPPGSSFDAERLWGQLRPELQAKPNRRRAWWWLSAACVSAVAAGWLVWSLPNGKPGVSPTDQMATYRAKTDTISGARPNQREEIPESAPTLAETHQQKRQRTAVSVQRVHRLDNVATVHESSEPEATTQVVETPVILITDAIPAPRKANIAAATPKRRFRVMHENELRAEDEAAPKLYRTDHFVRLGSGPTNNEQQRTNTTPDYSPPALVMPLTNH